ncbi:ABC transporter permease [Candidatus Sulfurimonas marisnigri]|uniref:ABC transporter permease n=1 Tax=Candidatus Sulfurimonas marisnigri TaxID=2740405 RepID=A0A7S7RRJ0_9BACT|nr:ABC transporter permease [Candidatus Sulfurimonas marisnigri]QOY55620.1 ABC transporter permease [Candidatus Sulfurimonas marisnigri]
MELIPAQNLLYMLLPLSLVWYFYYKWIDNSKEVLYASSRMVVQLFLIGYALVYIFENDSWYIGLLIIVIMITMSSFIALRNLQDKSLHVYSVIVFAIAIGGTINLVLVIKFVLELSPFYEPRYVIPIAGMIYANSMNAVSLGAERYEKELIISTYEQARKVALKASLIPKINTFLAVGIVSLPGMMTGQILSGVDPLIAVRYQIVVMAMIFSSAGISVVLYLLMLNKQK